MKVILAVTNKAQRDCTKHGCIVSTIFPDSEDYYRSGSRNTSHVQPYGLSEDYSHQEEHTRQTTDIPGFKPFTKLYIILQCTVFTWVRMTDLE